MSIGRFHRYWLIYYIIVTVFVNHCNVGTQSSFNWWSSSVSMISYGAFLNGWEIFILSPPSQVCSYTCTYTVHETSLSTLYSFIMLHKNNLNHWINIIAFQSELIPFMVIGEYCCIYRVVKCFVTPQRAERTCKITSADSILFKSIWTAT